MLSDIQNANRAETSASLLNENLDNIILRLVTVGETFITLIVKVKRKIWPGNMSLLHHPESYTQSHQSAKLWLLYSENLKELY